MCRGAPCGCPWAEGGHKSRPYSLFKAPSARRQMPRRMRTSRLAGAARAASRRRSRSTPGKESSRAKPIRPRTCPAWPRSPSISAARGGRLFSGERRRLGAPDQEQLVGEDQHRLGEVEGGLDGRAGDGDDGARQGQLLVVEAADLGAEDEGGGGVRRILGQPAGQLPGSEHGDAQAAVAGGGGAHHTAEGPQGGVQARRRARRRRGWAGRPPRRPWPTSRGPAPAPPGSGGEPHVGHGPGRRADIALFARADEDDRGRHHPGSTGTRAAARA